MKLKQLLIAVGALSVVTCSQSVMANEGHGPALKHDIDLSQSFLRIPPQPTVSYSNETALTGIQLELHNSERKTNSWPSVRTVKKRLSWDRRGKIAPTSRRRMLKDW